MSGVADYLKARAKEPSTWAGIATLATLFGVKGVEQFGTPEIAVTVAGIASALLK